MLKIIRHRISNARLAAITRDRFRGTKRRALIISLIFITFRSHTVRRKILRLRSSHHPDGRVIFRHHWHWWDQEERLIFYSPCTGCSSPRVHLLISRTSLPYYARFHFCSVCREAQWLISVQNWHDMSLCSIMISRISNQCWYLLRLLLLFFFLEQRPYCDIAWYSMPRKV